MLPSATTAMPRRLVLLLSPLIAYLALSIVLSGGLNHLTSRLIGLGGDSYTSIWCLKWWPWAIRHGVNPFVSYKVWYPEGIEMTWVTSVPAFAILVWPITALAGPVVTYNLLCLLAPALSAWAAFLLARHVTRSTVPALIAGYVYGFSNYEMGHRLGHLNLFAIFIPPLLVLACIKRLDGTLSRRGLFVALVAGFLLQFGISPEILCTTFLFGACAWLVFLVALPRARRRLLALGLEVTVAALGMALLMAPFLFFMIRGMRHLPPELNSPVVFSADLAGFLIPGALQHFGASYFAQEAARFTGNQAEQTAYLGLPLALILALYFAGHLSRPSGRALLAILSLLVVCSLGPVLWLNGVETGLTLPWSWMTSVPLVRSALPCRFTAYVFLLAGLVAALWLAQPGTLTQRVTRLALAALMCVSLWPEQAWTSLRTPLPQPPFFAQKAPVLPGRVVLILPFGPSFPGMVWQAQAHFSFAQAGGYTGLTPPNETLDPMFAPLIQQAASPGFEARLLAWCRTRGVDTIVAGPGISPAQLAALHSIGWSEQAEGGVRVFTRPPLRGGTS